MTGEEDILAYDRALVHDPRNAELWCERGVAQMRLHRLVAALQSFDKALALAPGHFIALVRRGNARLLAGHYAQAAADYSAALAIQPDSAGTLYNRGNAQKALNQDDAALADYERAMTLEPGLPFLEGARLQTRMQLCAWRDHDAVVADLLAHVEAGLPAAMPFQLVALPATPAQQLACARLYAAAKFPPAPERPARRHVHDKIRLAYLSAGLREHATGLLMAGVFEQHDRSRFETIAVSSSPDDGSALRRRLMGGFDQFLDVSRWDDDQVATRLRAMQIDILIDLDGFTAGSRTGIVARRLAPVQVNYIGYPGSMGAPYMDYIIADGTVAPPGAEAEFSEKLVRLPDSYQPNTSRAVATVPSRAECDLPEQGLVFCAFNNSFKITPDIFEVWMRLLAQVEDSVLWLLETGAKPNLIGEAETRGIAPARLVFAPRLDPAAHLARHACADLFLDTWHCNAHTTASDALWCGLPLVTCVGEAFAGRVAASLLKACGMEELVTHSLAAYEALALALARDPARLSELKARLWDNRDSCALFDTVRTTRALERAYQKMWERAEAGLPPEAFQV